MACSIFAIGLKTLLGNYGNPVQSCAILGLSYFSKTKHRYVMLY